MRVNFPYTPFNEIPVKCVPVDAKNPPNLVYRCAALLIEFNDSFLILSDFGMFVRVWFSWRTSHQDSHFPSQSQTLKCPLLYHLSFNFGGKSERKCQNLALNVISEHELVFDGVDYDLFCHTEMKHIHDHVKVTSETGDFAAYDDVAFLEFLEHRPEFSLVRIDTSAYSLVGNIFIDCPPFSLCEPVHSLFL